MLPIGFGHETGDLARYIGPPCQLMEIRLPWFKLTFGYLWFGSMVEYEALMGVLIDEACRFYELSFVDEDVVCKVEAGELSDAAIELRTVKISAGFPLGDVAEANQAAGIVEAAKNLGEVRSFKRSPAYYSSNERRRLCAFQQPACLFEGFTGLHGDGGIDVCRVQLSRQIMDEKVAAESRHVVVNPAELLRVIVPKMMVRIDAQRGR
jgi:hypothetical protein